MLKQQPHDLPTVAVRGRSLNEAMANVKRRYGSDAQIVESREARERDRDGLGETRLVEVVVALTGVGDAPASTGVPQALAEEVARIEALVREITAARRPEGDPEAGLEDAFPLSRDLLLSGVTRPAVRQVARTWKAEGADVDPLDHLAGLLQASGGDWDSFGGRHVVLGRPGSGKTTLVLGTAAALSARDRRVLVLALGPRHKGDIRQLQEESRLHGYDAAILRRGDQLTRASEHFDAYDVVLIDTPAVGTPFMADPATAGVLAGDENMHRHLAVPLDADASALADGWMTAKEWNCDWVAPTRFDLAANHGKLVDVLLAAPCPVSLLSKGPWPGPEPVIPSARQLVDAVLSGGGGRRERPVGLAAKAREV